MKREAWAKRWTKESRSIHFDKRSRHNFRDDEADPRKFKTQPVASREKMLVRVPGQAELLTAQALDRAWEAPGLAQELG